MKNWTVKFKIKDGEMIETEILAKSQNDARRKLEAQYGKIQIFYKIHLIH